MISWTATDPSLPIPPNWRMKEIRHFINNRELKIQTSGKGRNFPNVLNDVIQALTTQKDMPNDILTYLLGFIDWQTRVEWQVISKTFQKCVLQTNNNDKDMDLHISGFVSKGI